MKSRPLAVALLLSLTPAVVLPPRAAFAQAATDDASTRMARARFQEGVAFFDKHQYEQARAAFLQAYALRKHPVVLLNLAQSSLKSGHTLESARYFRQFLKEYSSASQAERSDAETGLTEAHQKLGRIDVSSAPSGAEIWIDDERAGLAPFDHPIEVEPGTHAVGARGRGGDESVQVTANAGAVVTARFGAQSAPVAAAPVPVAQAPAAAPPAEPPPSEAPPPANDDVVPAPASTTDQASHGGGFWPTHTAPLYVFGVLTVAGFATAIVMGVEKSSAQTSSDSVATQINNQIAIDAKLPLTAGQQPLQSHGACSNPDPRYAKYAGACSVLHSDNNKVNTDALIANIGLGIGIAAGVTTVIYMIAGSREPASTTASLRPRVTPMIGPGLGGLQVGAAF